MKIIFKNVDQGDSIIIEWNSKQNSNIGIIDCNLQANGKNPTLEYIRSNGFKKIEFIILSHPHSDHFSGLLELFEFCDRKKIQVNYFLHTAGTTPELLQLAVTGISEKRLLSKIFRLADIMTVRKQILNSGFVSNLTREFQLSDGCFLKFLSPSQREYNNYNKRKYRNFEEVKKNRSDANLLSTLIKIYTEDWYLILSSDTTAEIFAKQIRYNHHEFKTPLVLGQLPHHGSESNFEKSFWGQVKKQSQTPAVLSVGENDYGHPSAYVVNTIRDYGFRLYSTNQVGSLNQSKSLEAKSISSSLDLVSSAILTTVPKQDDDLNGDKIFELKGQEFVLI